jgi:hypothetical protein
MGSGARPAGRINRRFYRWPVISAWLSALLVHVAIFAGGGEFILLYDDAVRRRRKGYPRPQAGRNMVSQ